MTRPRRTLFALLTLLVLVPVAAAALQSPASAQEDSDDGDERRLAETYAPVLVLKAQDAECDDDGEPYAPADVDIVLGNPQIALRQVGNDDPVVTWGPTAADLFGLGEGFYLDFPGDALDPGCVYERDFRRFGGDPREATVYAHVVEDPAGGRLALQYWFWWYYNDWNNRHESDWEGIQILFDVGTVAEASRSEPTSVGYAQHEGGEQADWTDAKLRRDGTRPYVYSSAGSHASYFSSALYLGRSGGEGFGCDTTDGPSDVVSTRVQLLPSTVADPADDFAWLGFEGRWGERKGGPFNGPTGPATKERWDEPFAWHDDLRSGSVVVPGGDGVGDTIVQSFCGVVEWGSRQTIALQRSPVRLALSLLAVALLVRWLVRRTSWSPTDALPVRRRRRAGEILRAGVHLYRTRPAPFARIGLLYVPIALLAGGIAALVSLVPFVARLAEVAGERSEVRIVLALLASGFGNLLAWVFVNAAVAAGLDDLEKTGSASWRDCYRVLHARGRELLAGFARASAIVLVLFVSVIGIPWGVRQLVRYQYLPQAVVLDGLDHRRALARSAGLVRGRWWHTALMTAVFNALVALGGLAVGLLLLVVVPQLPLWLFSVVVTGIYALVATYGAVGMTLLYGDAYAEASDLPPARPRRPVTDLALGAPVEA